MIHLQSQPDGIAMAVPVICLDQRRMWADLHVIDGARGFRVVRNSRQQIVRALEIETSEPATPRRHTSQAGESGIQDNLWCARVYALKNERGKWI